ncbi:hypothetical protein [Streptomyces sp. NPDC006856]|uniref:hypothetical protein n=2 Tax=Streptomyces TaxID=1883 RepID=UPI0036A8FCE8
MSSEDLMEQLIKKMAEDGVWQNWIAANSAQEAAKNGCISAAPKNGCISAAPKAGCIS